MADTFRFTVAKTIKLNQVTSKDMFRDSVWYRLNKFPRMRFISHFYQQAFEENMGILYLPK